MVDIISIIEECATMGLGILTENNTYFTIVTTILTINNNISGFSGGKLLAVLEGLKRNNRAKCDSHPVFSY